jgi:hypothetical protein
MKILVLHLDPARRDALAASLREDGHDVTAVSAPPLPTFTPEVFVVCTEASPQRTLDLAAKIGADAQVEGAAILFAGGTPAALTEAQRRFPKASFTRLDALSTSLASMEN